MSASTCSLECACTALWSATLSLMAAYMQQPAPAHRLLLARRIAANFDILAQQDSFSRSSRESFARLQQRWQAIARRLAQPSRPEGGRGLLAKILSPSQKRL